MKKEYVIIIALAALAAVWYFFIRDKSTLVIAPGLTGSQPNPSLAPTINSTPTMPTTATGSPSQTLAVAIPGVNGGASTVPDSIIFPWIEQLDVVNKQHAYQVYPSISTIDKVNWANVIYNYWDKGVPVPEALTNWWMIFQKQYSINMLPANSFTKTILRKSNM